MWVLAPEQSPDGQEEFDVDRIHELLTEAASLGTGVVIEAPPVMETADAQVLCSAAGRTLIVLDTRRARAAETAAATSLLERTGAGLLGAVLVKTGRTHPQGQDDGPQMADVVDRRHVAHR
jgi:Mrp family chromosome partitioning ATPase